MFQHVAALDKHVNVNCTINDHFNHKISFELDAIVVTH